MARDFMAVLVIDCTYKTNRFNMPLLNAIILTGMNTILPFAQVWLPGEAEPDFENCVPQLRQDVVPLAYRNVLAQAKTKIQNNLAVDATQIANASRPFSFTNLLTSEDTAEFESTVLPPPSWNFAGLNSLDN
ncbi:hypothetical protein L915_11696 [Phytophthora nicotianae]|uniref:MULE transposase domain-containing protein n=1 Tax=Phytophthora nicotianae TaxID=4792 RepID=W2GL45_PHYNI|nr:hypothetical protein L915_11696 [Phytophthora nicotianae]